MTLFFNFLKKNSIELIHFIERIFDNPLLIYILIVL